MTQVQKTRERIQSGLLVSHLEEHALGKREMTPTQIKAAEILLKKCIPDWKSVEHTGEAGAAIELKVRIEPHIE